MGRHPSYRMSVQDLSAAALALKSRQAGRNHRGVVIDCPHCGGPAGARTSKLVTPLFKEIRYQCENIDGEEPCGHTFVASLTIERTINPSATPNPRIQLPIGATRKRPVLAG